MTDDLEASYEKAVKKLKEMAQLIRNGEHMEFEPLRLQSEIQPKFPKEKYTEMVEKAKHYIREGDIFQVVLSNPMRARATGSLFDTYRVLRASNPSPYMFYFSSDDIELAGASPETLAKLENGALSTFPLAGTRPRGKTREEDKELEEGLLKDEKELAEHNMLVDLGRNDIGKISKIGTVKVEKYLCVERFSHVMHLGSTVTGIIRDDKDAVDAVDAILPAGTLSGAPKFRACQIIEELEQSKRGIYGAPSDIWILQEIWIPVLPSAWFIRKTEKSVSVQVPESWQTVYRKRNFGNAATRQEQWYRQLNRHRRD